jgi:hypothetical protein
MAIGKETLLAAAPRADDKVTLDSPGVTRSLQNAPGDWSHYARAALLRLQHEQHE